MCLIGMTWRSPEGVLNHVTNHFRRCGTCDQSGVKPGTTPSTCSACGGAGQQVSAVRTPLGMFQQVRASGLKFWESGTHM